MRILLMVAGVLALAAWAIETTRMAMAKWERRRRAAECSLCRAPLRPARPGEDVSGFWYCGACVLAMREARTIYSKLERRAS